MAISSNRRALLTGLVWFAAFSASAAADPPPGPPPPLTIDAAIRTALEQNPEILALRQDHGVAAAGVLIARAYPFNPIWDGQFRYAWPFFEGATNNEPVSSTVMLELELRHQGKYRRAAAKAVLSRTDWDIAAQELALTVRVIRAFDTVVYRYQKNKLVLDTITLNEQTAEKAHELVTAGKLRPADEIILLAELDDARASLGQSRTALAMASSDLRAALGLVGGPLLLQGDLNPPPLPDASPEELTEAARARRPERQSRDAAVAEADARLRLERANRFGNPTIGPTYEEDNGSVHNLGFSFSMPLPVLNTHRADILQREAEKGRAELDLRRTDVQIGLEVEAALQRLQQARAWAERYEKEALPNLNKRLEQIKQLFYSGDPTVDALRILDMQRKVFKANDGYLDAQLEVRQAVADLAAALGDPSVAVGPLPPAPCRPLPGKP